MASEVELRKIKKKYGERFMHMCRDLFPTILEQEGVLLSILEKKFANNSRTLYEDIQTYSLEVEFKDFIYSIFDNKLFNNEEIEKEKTPYELLDEAGYTLYECKTEKEIQEFKKYYAKNEVLCTFNGGRLDGCVVFFAVKKNVDEIKRENFKDPKREDEYGTSVMSIQFSKFGLCIVSIKNRYNHRVSNPDATYGNDLDRIIPGLSKSFERLLLKRGLEFNDGNIERFGFPNYVVAGDGKYYKYNLEIGGNYYCPGNIIISQGEVISIGSPEKIILVENFAIDLVNKTITQYGIQHHAEGYIGGGSRDSFTDAFKDIEKIEISKDKSSKDGERVIIIKKKDSEFPIEIRIDRDNQIIGYKNLEITYIGNNFLMNNRRLKHLELPMLTNVEESFLEHNKELETLTLPKLRYLGNNALMLNVSLRELILPELHGVGTNFLYYNEKLESLDLPQLDYVGSGFLRSNKILSSINLPKLKRAGNFFLYENNELESLELPSLSEVENEFLYNNNKLKRLHLPKLETAGNGFLYLNHCLVDICLSSLTSIGRDGLCHNEELLEIDLPSILTIDDNFMRENEKLKRINASSLTEVGKYFLGNNLRLTELSLPKLKKAKKGFLSENRSIKSLYLPKLTEVDDYFLQENIALVSIILPKLKVAGDDFLLLNTGITKVEMPLLEKVGHNFMGSNTQLKELNLPSLRNVGMAFLADNECLTQIELENLSYAGARFLLHNKRITHLSLPKLAIVGNYFMPYNNNIACVVLPARLSTVGLNFLGGKLEQIKPEHLARLDKEKELSSYDIEKGRQIVFELQNLERR